MPVASRSFWMQAADSITVRVLERFCVAALMIVCGFMLTTGRSVMSSAWDAKIEEGMRPRLDAADRRADTLALEIQDMRRELGDIRGSEREFFGAQMDLDPRFRRAVEARVARNQAQEKQKRENDSALNGLLREK